MKTAFLQIIFMLFPIVLLAQKERDTLHLKSFEVIANRAIGNNPGLDVQGIQGGDNATRASYSLGELLSRESSVFIKSYSPGMLASPSIRGTGAAHTAVIWNGLNLQSSMNGQLDLNLIPGALFDQFTLQKGAQSALWGSGSIGGTLFIEHGEINEFTADVDQYTGSFSHSRTSFAVKVPGKVSLSIRAFTSSALNDFEYIDITHINRPLVRQNNAAVSMSGMMTNVSIKTGKRHTLEVGSWIQTSLRHIPPIMTVPSAKALQEDYSLRNSVNWNWRKRSHSIDVRAGYFEEDIRFNDSLVNLQSFNQARTFISELDYTLELPHLGILGIGYNYTSSWANAGGYGNKKVSQDRQAVFAQLRRTFLKNKIQAMAGIRKEVIDDLKVPYIPFLSAAFKLSRMFELKGQWTKSYRIPTLNDLYWIPGGNSGLKPEYGRNAEFGVYFNTVQQELKSTFSICAFNSIVSNWILWTPGNSYWSPHNVQEVRVNGLDMNGSVSLTARNIAMQLRGGLQFASSKASKSIDFNEPLQKRQLIYVPYSTAFVSGLIEYKSSSLELQINHVGYRYTTTDNTSFLPAFTLANLTLAHNLNYSNGAYHVLIQVNNIFNTVYQAIEWRAMPMRNYLVGIRLHFKPNKNN